MTSITTLTSATLIILTASLGSALADEEMRQEPPLHDERPQETDTQARSCLDPGIFLGSKAFVGGVSIIDHQRKMSEQRLGGVCLDRQDDLDAVHQLHGQPSGSQDVAR